MSRRTFARLSIAGAAATLHGGYAGAAKGPVVMELFTSQGCSSCLPADALMAELGQRPGVIALSLHVDYWDYLGWRDTLGSPDCAQRQREYARRRGDGQVYTPQLIVSGQAAMVGSDRQGVLDAIAIARDHQASVSVAIESRERELVVEVAAAPAGHLVADATVWVIAVVPSVVIDIRRGENAGRTVAYTNVVRKIIPAGMWHGDKLDLSLPKQAIVGTGATCAALLQIDGTGPIIGAGWMAGADA
ncbi:MAG TPA: DUF1223 domain-containing protein [Aestuariivirgaceae bacterium]|nr:DUF1223 domain-containing protein [Aestuariivirgaceae bacterium]